MIGRRGICMECGDSGICPAVREGLKISVE